MQEETFSAPWDNLVKGITGAVFLLMISLIILLGLASGSLVLTIALAILFGSTLFLPYLWSPRSYIVRDNLVVVRRPIGDLTIDMSKQPRLWKWTWWGLRLFGSGGLYGYYGYFAFKGTGRVRMHATNRHNMVLIEDARGRKHLISPDRPKEFIKQTQALPT